ncbi:MAG: hypothetical protein LLF98_02300 [Clostridium sp.]|uniref:hypothetical protein n=1 Tax=Clostridium sp. TaxID=1506 RepID=UPI0025B91137|nr:hypothetical protein [Clostridium sp.]MCE5220113.1 hypothetical protein [Clostridium sp.]
MKGYKATNGNYITGKELESAQRKFKKQQIEYRKQKEQEEEIQNQINIAKYIAEKQEQKQYQEKQQELLKVKDKILLALRQNNPFTYKQYLIIWDILTTNYDQIFSDLNKKRIIKDDILKVIQYVKGFSSELLNPYWEERLINTL